MPNLNFFTGPFVIVFVKPVSLRRFQNIKGTTVNKNKVTVENGSFQIVMGGIQFYSGTIPFGSNYDSIVKVRQLDGTIIWENSMYA